MIYSPNQNVRWQNYWQSCAAAAVSEVNIRNLVSTMFYGSIHEHLHKESTLTQLDTWLCTYRTIILQSKTQTVSNKEEREKAIKAAKSDEHTKYVSIRETRT